MANWVLKVFGAFALLGGFWLSGLAPDALVAGAAAQSSSTGATPISRLTVSELAGTWIEPVTQSDDGSVITRGSENIVEIAPDGQFNDALEIKFQFRSNPDFDGLYRFKSWGRVSIAAGQISWAVERASVVAVIPDDASPSKRQAMSYLAKELTRGMEETETYPIISYDGNKLVMNASGNSDMFDEYIMTRR